MEEEEVSKLIMQKINNIYMAMGNCKIILEIVDGHIDITQAIKRDKIEDIEEVDSERPHTKIDQLDISKRLSYLG